jgi:uncharacterized membrane protein YphA (DoxX/SURF4 family)
LYGSDGFGDPGHFDAVFSPPFLRWSLLRVLPPNWGPPALLTAWGLAAVGLLVGYRPRLMALVCWVAAVSFAQANLHLHNGGDQLKMIVLLMLVFLTTDGRWAVRPNPAARGTVGQVLIKPWPIRLLIVQLAVMYFMNGYYKAMGPGWRDGSVMYYVANNPSWAHFSPDFLPLPIEGWKSLAWATVVWELLFPLLVALPTTRAVTLWVGVLFHVGTLVHLEVGLFPMYALCYYVPFVPWERCGRPTSRELTP